jgi:hypothetical protein
MPLEPPAPATCPRCGCKLSRYRDAWQTHCLTCERTLKAEGALTVPDFAPDEWVSAAEEARQAATTPLRCTRCDTPLAKGRNKTGRCKKCFTELTTKAARERGYRKVCGYCAQAIDPGTWRRARRQGRTPRCRDCATRQRAKAKKAA